MSSLAFSAFSLIGVDAEKFLQGQVTLNVAKLAEHSTRYSAICNLKGRIQLGLWIKKIADQHFELVCTQDQAETLSAHLKKYGAFSKMRLEALGTRYPVCQGIQTEFQEQATDITAWQLQAIDSGQAWINQINSELFQPQELRLHQRDGVHFDKGCYLGQEIIARLWFKAKPKQWLHLIEGQGAAPQFGEQLLKTVQVVNSIAIGDGYRALVVAKPESLRELNVTVIDLPEALNGDVARPQH
ncbi:CAF17-like 4Fe-4S cluster assembly/insertion protein YgfZ [Acinetobacter larvae]|uniref:Folate-binding protein YgfZ n=1 Tax=Acinetobacter larvae TaxID=1789224 RepID=A0A1B2M3V6_9GAMM|nr:aminomethyltransferase [Acinetobacter larvae]AOA59854.1 folate-binding protein YgfZ [Acinetobacter larvae]